jgi:LDH2 family malate/lactate/ureidoglycolate dehydrogenase
LNEKIFISPEELKSICISSLCKNGVSEEEAKLVIDTMIEADMRGVTSHGIQNLPVYIKRIQNGGINIKAKPEVIQVSENQWLIDGKGCLGQIAAIEGVKLLAEAGKKNKVAVVGVKNTNHCGMLAYYTKRISSENCIGFMCSNANPTMAAFGGAEPVLGTNPFSVAIPYKKSHVIVDMATSSVAKGKIYEYERKGLSIPVGWALDFEGKPTSSAVDALNGVLLPFAGHKGYSIALIVEILSGVLTGSAYSKMIFSLHKDADKIQNVGFFMAIVPITPFMDIETFNKRLEVLLSIVKNSKKQEGVEEILFPGELEERLYEKSLTQGIGIDKEILDQIKSI